MNFDGTYYIDEQTPRPLGVVKQEAKRRLRDAASAAIAKQVALGDGDESLRRAVVLNASLLQAFLAEANATQGFTAMKAALAAAHGAADDLFGGLSAAGTINDQLDTALAEIDAMSDVDSIAAYEAAGVTFG